MIFLPFGSEIPLLGINSMNIHPSIRQKLLKCYYVLDGVRRTEMIKAHQKAGIEGKPAST